MRRLCGLMLLLAVGSGAQPKRPKIALALEGGAALGFAHVGVLEWLEANKIPVDMIAGTSMGGLIGGLYAAGYTPAQIRAIANEANWPLLLGGETPFRELGYRRKEDRLAFPNRLELGVNNGLKLPAGFNEGHQIGLLLSRLTLGYPSLASFDELPTPFRCVSADLVSGASKVWDRGLLNEALRSTMSIPALFSPVRKDKGIYVDGGLLDNLPVDVARRMGADLVIAVHLTKGPVDPGKINSLIDVMGRSISVVIGAAEMRTIAQADVLLVAEVGQYATTDYAKSNEIAAIGTQAAEAKANILRRFALDEAAYAEFKQRRDARIRKAPVEPTKSIAVVGANDAVRARLEGVKLENLDLELNKIVGQGRYSSMTYQRKDGGLEVRANPRVGGPIFLSPGFEINGVDSSDTRFSLGTRVTWLDFLSYRGEWRNDIWFGSRFGATSEYYRPLRPNSRFFIAPRLIADSNPFDLYADARPISSYRLLQLGAGFDTGITFNRFSELRLGYQFNQFRAKQRIGLPISEAPKFRRDVLSLRFRFEGQDDAIVARAGGRIFTRLETYPEFGNSLAELRGGYSFRVSRNNSLVTSFAGGAAIGPAINSFLSFNLGGPQLLGAYGLNEILARNYSIGTVGLLHEIPGEPSLLGSKMYLLGLVQGGRTYDIFADTRYPANATGAVVLRTLFGPVFVGGSYGDRGRNKWFFGMGRVF